MLGKVKMLSDKIGRSATVALIEAGLVLALALFVFFGIDKTLGWFSSNDEVQAGGMVVAAAGVDGVVESVEYFEITSISSANNYNVYEFSNVPIDASEAELKSFSALVAKRQLLVKITLKSVADITRIYATTGTEQYITEGTPQASGNPLSSIVEFRLVTPGETEKTDHSYVISAADTTAYHFAEKQTNDQGEVVFSLNANTGIAELSGVSEVYIIVDYYEESARYAMEIINALILSGNISLEMNQEIGFVCDFQICVA